MALKLTIIGAGPGGYVAAIRAAQRGADVTILEDREVGGTCLNRGCIPTKTLIASAELLRNIRNAEGFGVEIPTPALYNLVKIQERTNNVVSVQIKGIRSLFKSWGVKLIPARGSLLDANVVRAVQADGTTQDIKSDKIIIATGSRPSGLPGIAPDGERIITSDEAVLFRNVPKSMVIIGAGVIGCEFAFLYRMFGSEVTLVEMAPRALSSEDEEISSIIERELKKQKIRLIANTKINNISVSSANAVVQLSNGQNISADQVLVSIGRSMNSENLGLDHAGVRIGKRGEIVVNERMETNVSGIYAVGDVTGRLMLAHVASHQGLVAVENILGGNASMDYTAVPSGIFTMPEVGSVGIREHQAEERGMSVKIGRFQYRSLGKAHAMGEIAGMIKIIADAATDRVVGVHICGAHATDLVHEGALAVKFGITARELNNIIHAHPTLAEGIMEAAGDVHSMAIHIPKSSN